jgi:DNA polymerase II
MTELTGWLLDLYANGPDLTLWLLGDDGTRHCLYQAFPVSFYAAGSSAQLRSLWRWLSAQPEPLRLARTERRDLFAGPITVLQAEVQHPGDLPRLFHRAASAFPGLTYYDADVPLALRYAAGYGAFPLGRLRLDVAGNRIRTAVRLDSPWDLDPQPPPLRVVTIEPDCDPAHAEPGAIVLTYEKKKYWESLRLPRTLLINLAILLERFDPDLILTRWGDTWLLPHLLKLSEETGLPLPLNRDPAAAITRKDQRTYYAYGQVIYRGAQVHLAGRWHIDICNAVMYHDYGVEGIFELARVTGLPVQTTARVSPGTGISAMQIATAFRQGVLVPWHKQQAEAPKTALELIRADMGGLVYQPTIGLHADVAEIDFVSMYPSVMVRFNISPETILPGRRDPETDLPATRPGRGLVPETLEPLLRKRIALKAQLMTLPGWDPRLRRFKAYVSAYKWLLVTCFGYLGYKNARFGRIEAHEAVTAYGREALLRAKEVAEDLGFEVLHLYVDGMWIKKPGARTPADFQPVLDAILERTGLPIGLDGVFRWVAFLPSRVDARVPVANRYFGVFQSGEIKARGIELRRRDTPVFLKELQQEMLEILARASSVDGVADLLPELDRLVRRRLWNLRQGRIPPDKLAVVQTLSRELDLYRSPSPAAIAAKQLADAGKALRPGQYVRFVHTLGEPGVRAWDLAGEIDPQTIDIQEYKKLFLRAVETIRTPFQEQPLDLGQLTALPLFALPAFESS